MQMKILILGSGYVGLVTGVCFAEKGHEVFCVDIDKKKVGLISKGASPMFEPGLEELLKRNVEKGRLRAFLAEDFYAKNIVTDASFICVPTPSKRNGSIDLRFVENVSRDLGLYIKSLKKYHVVTVKSTVIPGTTENVVLPLLEKYSGKKVGKDFGLCMNPEFLKEGSAVEDFLHSHKIVLGSYDEKSREVLEKVYEPWDKKIPRIKTNLKTAEMIKYAQNAFLATKISFINEIANIAHRCGVDAKEVAHAMGLDPRISPKFLKFGVGFGGSCFPKDVKALISFSKQVGYEPKILESVIEVNEKQPLEALKMINDLEGKTVSILGLSFKPGTDDIREAPSLKLIEELKKHNVKIKAYDPKAMGNVKKVFPDIEYADSPLDTLKGSDVCFLLTEWDEFKKLKPKDFTVMNNPMIIDGRRFLNAEELEKSGIKYKSIGYGK